MGLKDIGLKQHYDSDKDDILNAFYIPALSHSIKYSRIAGFFSSTSFSLAARGISSLVRNKGKMRLIIGAFFSKDDIAAIKEGLENPVNVLEAKIMNELDSLEDDLVRDHVRALAWMVANGSLEIKMAIVLGEDRQPIDSDSAQLSGIFHPKIGILSDSYGNSISFSGSENESASAWVNNIEEFKVFRFWEPGEKSYFESDVEKFERFWSGKGERTKVIEIPEAIEKKLIRMAPKNIEELELEKYYSKERKKQKAIQIWDTQKEAIIAWLSQKRGILEMATGTGKTFTALGCTRELLKEATPLVIVVSCPYSHLIEQWSENIDEFGFDCQKVKADSTNPKWANEMTDKSHDLENGYIDKLFILTTHATLSSKKFIDVASSIETKMLLIADEVHWLGAPKLKEGLIEKYEFRLALSATPKRWIEEESEVLEKYFGKTVYEFPIKKAINTINPATGKTYLVPYEYKPFFVEMTEQELEKYEKETKKIARAYYASRDEKGKNEVLSILIAKRADIVRNAINKRKIFDEILSELKPIEHCLAYCSPDQMKWIQSVLNKKGIKNHKFTGLENPRAEKIYEGLSERQFILKNFAEKNYQALVAMKCLDEGVDVPPARVGILLASTTNPKQYIQRRGRLLRNFPGKKKAVIYDIIVTPRRITEISEKFKEIENKILQIEVKRFLEFADASMNAVEAMETLKRTNANCIEGR